MEQFDTQGSRLYTIDRECYVVYLGKADRKYRPFLRIGTSAYLPGDIKRHIGSVVLTDRLTGDYFQETLCLEKPVSHHMHYVGSHELIEAVRHFIRNEQIAEHPLKPGDRTEETQGSKVVFYGDGNLRIFLDGHRLFDLLEREKQDQHWVHILSRTLDILSASELSTALPRMEGSGFIHLQGEPLLIFRNWTVQNEGLSAGSFSSLAQSLIAPSQVRIFKGTHRRDALLALAKFLKIRRLPLEFVLEDDQQDEAVQDFIRFLNQSGAKADQSTGIALPENHPLAPVQGYPAVFSLMDGDPQSPSQVKSPLELSGEHAWKAGLTPPLLHGVPYRLLEPGYTAHADSASAREQLLQFMGSQGRSVLESSGSDSGNQGDSQQLEPLSKLYEEIRSNEAELDPVTRLSLAVFLWNSLQELPEAEDESEDEELDLEVFSGLPSLIQHMQKDIRLPLSAEVQEHGGIHSLRFLLNPGVTRKSLSAAAEARNKLEELYRQAAQRPDYEQERKRLSATLQSLLQSRQVHNLAEAKAPQQAPAPKNDESTVPAEAGALAPADKAEAADTADTTVAANSQAGESASRETDTQTSAMESVSGLTTGSGTSGAGSGHDREQHAILAQPTHTASASRGSVRWGRVAIGLGLLAAAALIIWLLFRPEPTTLGGEDMVADGGRSTEQTGDQGTQDTGGTAENNPSSDSPDSSGDSSQESENSSGNAVPGQETESSGTTGSDQQNGSESGNGDSEQNGTSTDSTSTQADDNPENQESDEENEVIASDQRMTGPGFSGEWTSLEVLRFSNWIAFNNGYALIGEEVNLKRDPDWIFPGNSFTLPDGSTHRVSQGETIWIIASAFLDRAYQNSNMSLDQFHAFLDTVNYNQTIEFKNSN